MPKRAKASTRGGMLSGTDSFESVESRRRRLWPDGVPLAPPLLPAHTMLPGMLGADGPTTPLDRHPQ